MADDLPPPPKKPLVTVEFQTEVDIATGNRETRMFVKMYFDARDSGLLAHIGDRRWRTLCALATYMDETGLCYPSQSRIAKDLAITRETVNRRIQELLAYRFQGKPVINVRKARLSTTNGGRWSNNVYQILPVTGLQIFADDQAKASEKPTDSTYVTESSHRPVCVEPNTGSRHTNQNQRFNQKVVNALTANDQKPIPKKEERRTPTISNRALRATYGFTDEQLAQVYYLVEKQTTLLGSADRNHAHYVKRAAEAITAGSDQLLDLTLGDFKQAATALSVDSAPKYFHAMWKEALQKHRPTPRAAEIEETTRHAHRQGFEPLSATLASMKTIPGDDAAAKITRMLDDATRRGFPVPESIRRSGTFQTVAQWWAALPERAEQRGRSGAP